MKYAGMVSIAGMGNSTNAFIQELNQLYLSKTGICGTSHDQGQNYFIGLLPEGWRDTNYILLEKTLNQDNSDNLEELEIEIGKILVGDSDTLIVASRELWQELFARPLYHLWCCNYNEDKDALEAAYDNYFGTSGGLDKRSSYANLVIFVRAKIKELLITP